jgi:hypothetical protein
MVFLSGESRSGLFPSDGAWFSPDAQPPCCCSFLLIGVITFQAVGCFSSLGFMGSPEDRRNPLVDASPGSFGAPQGYTAAQAAKISLSALMI